MRVYAENFEKIGFTESEFEAPVISGATMRVRAIRLPLLHGHPLLSEGHGPYSGWLVFSGVTHSSRIVFEHIGGPMAPGGFKEPYRVEDGPFPLMENVPQNEYAFEGRQVDPWAWIDNWIVTAESFRLEVE